MSAKERGLRELFDEIDTDGGGTLDRGEIKALADKLGVAMSKRELDLAMKEMDEDGSGEVDFEEFAEWWPQQEAKNSALVAAMNDRWSGALKRAQELRREKQDQTEAQRALEAVAKSHATMMRQVNDAEEKNKLLKQAIVQLKEELQESSDQRAAERESANDASEDYEAQIRALIEKTEEQQRQLARAASVLETEQTRREQDVRTLSLAHEDLQGKIERKDIRIEALVGQVEGLEWQLRQARSANQSERERTGQVVADMERIREKVNREKQGDVARREDQVTTTADLRLFESFAQQQGWRTAADLSRCPAASRSERGRLLTSFLAGLRPLTPLAAGLRAADHAAAGYAGADAIEGASAAGGARRHDLRPLPPA